VTRWKSRWSDCITRFSICKAKIPITFL